MTINRRRLLTRTGLALTAATVASSCGPAERTIGGSLPWPRSRGGGDWEAVRRQFRLSPERIHMSAMLLSSHPTRVREAIARHRDGLDADPVLYLERNNSRLTRETRAAAAHYLGVDTNDVALTDSTTMGVGLVYGSLRLRPGQEILTTDQDYFVTHESIRLAAERSGAGVRRISLHEDARTASEDQIVSRIAQAVTPATRVLGLTWVHSSTGLKLPLRQIADAVEDLNADREDDARVLLCIDGVHGFGNQDVTLGDLRCDFLAAGCHKWLFGPRGTGILAATRRGWDALTPTIPSFIDEGVWNAWLNDDDAPQQVDGRTLTPGGFKSFEHQWALAQAFELHQELGKKRIAERTGQLAAQLKDGLARMPGVVLHTPRSDRLSAGIVAFDIDGMDPQTAVNRLRDRRIVASVAPYATPHVRLTPSILNTPQEVEVALREVRALAA
jgi:isopenicillin-N epimerase